MLINNQFARWQIIHIYTISTPIWKELAVEKPVVVSKVAMSLHGNSQENGWGMIVSNRVTTTTSYVIQHRYTTDTYIITLPNGA